jgi:RecJ-like exonuclease
MPMRDVARDSDSCRECGARFITAPCRLCKGTGQSLLFFKCRECGGAGKKMVCPNFLSHLRTESGSQTLLPNRHHNNAMALLSASARR